MRTTSQYNFMMFRCSIFRSMMACFIALASLNAHAGNITFSMSLTGPRLTLSAQEGSSAFYPAVSRMLPDGSWQPLALAPGFVTPAVMVGGSQLEFVWPDARPLQSLPLFERIQPMMVRFFDQAGVSLGQISFFNQPPLASEKLQADYAAGQLVITPPAEASSTILSSWLLWSQEEGIAPIRTPIKFDLKQPSARHIVWRPGMEKLRVDTGAGQPSAMLLHDTTQGYVLQVIPSGGLQGREQRSAWLDASAWFYGAGSLAASIAVLMLLLNFVRSRRKGVQA